MHCSNNLKQMSLGTIHCADTNGGKLPPSVGLYPNAAPTAGNSNGGLFLHILPYIEQNNLFNSSSIPNDQVAPGDGRNGPNQTYSQWTPQVQQSRVKTYICTSDQTQKENLGGYASYAAERSHLPAQLPVGRRRPARLPAQHPGWDFEHHLLHREDRAVRQHRPWRRPLHQQLLAGLGTDHRLARLPRRLLPSDWAGEHLPAATGRRPRQVRRLAQAVRTRRGSTWGLATAASGLSATASIRTSGGSP